MLIEEAYEVIDAISSDSYEHLREELGDLLFQVIFLSHISKEKKKFDVYDVVDDLVKKMRRRHPHVFGDFKAKNSKEALASWNSVKIKEKKDMRSVLSGVPQSLPALIKAFRISEKAASVGFDWKNTVDIIKKMEEEDKELRLAIKNNNLKEIEEEIGDLIFALVNLARKFNLDPESALNSTNTKFIKRFNYIEKKLVDKKLKFKDCDLNKLEEFWQESKKDK